MTFDLEKARKIVGAMSPTPWIVLEDRYGQIDVIRNPNHPMHEEGVIELWGMTSETATPDAIGISYMRSEFPNALDEIERLRGEMENYGDDYVCQMKSKDARIQELEDAHKRSGEKYAKIINELRSSVYANMPGLKKQWDEILNTPANDKIGPDAKPRSPQESDDLKHCHSCGKSIEEVKGNLCKGDYFIGSIFLDPGQEASRFDPPIDASYYFSCCDCARSWQITEERKAAIMETIDLLNGDLFRSPYSDVLAVLRGMLTEADHDKP
jgi:hypothetical protein